MLADCVNKFNHLAAVAVAAVVAFAATQLRSVAIVVIAAENSDKKKQHTWLAFFFSFVQVYAASKSDIHKMI